MFTVVFIANMIAFLYVIGISLKLSNFINATAINLLCVVLSRHAPTINTMYKCVCCIPRFAPIRLRSTAIKVAQYGGIHSGCGLAALLWYVRFVAMLTRDHLSKDTPFTATPVVFAIACILLTLLLAIVIVAHPSIRAKHCDYFEFIHRFASWLFFALFWPLLVFFALRTKGTVPLGYLLFKLPAFWILLLLNAILIHPWLHLRKIPVIAEPISDYAIRLYFVDSKPEFARSFVVSTNPFRNWHAIAEFPDMAGESGSCIVLKAGAWTSRCIESPPRHLWKRSVPTSGFGYCLKMFNSCIIMVTGSGIGPCLSILGLEDRPRVRVVWQATSPLATYGQEVIDNLRRLDPESVIKDAANAGKETKCQDLLPDILDLVKQVNAESVGVISNRLFVKQMLLEVQAKGIPAFGQVFDS